MTTAVITVTPDDLLQDVARTLLKHRISGVPVVDATGKLAGIVTEGDLMRRVETGTEVHRSWWLRALAQRETLALDYVRAHATKVADVMTTKAVTARPDTPLGDIASMLERRRIKRVPIVENGKVVGIVSRANLLQAFASTVSVPTTINSSDDKDIRERVLARLRAESWGSPSAMNIIVLKGVAELWGAVASEAEHKAIRITAETTPGVVSVRDNLTVGQMPAGI
jgi:CBS domain-containing protein